MNVKFRLLRITTVPISLKLLLGGQLLFFQQHGFEVLAVSADGPEIPSLQADGIAHRIVPMTRKITPLQDLMCLFLLIRIMLVFKPHIVHTHTPKAGLLGMLAAWFCRIPVRMHTVAGLPLMESSGIKRRMLVWVERITYACASRVYPNAEGLKKIIEKEITTRVPLKIIGRGSSNGINTGIFCPTDALKKEAQQIRQQAGICPKDVVFSFVGRIVKDKGIRELIDAFKQMQEQSARTTFLLLIGNFEQELDPLTDEEYAFLHDHPRVVLAGFQHDVRPWIMASDIFVFPSYREGFPNVVMQACCLEVPCIVSDINGCNEIIQQGETGLIVKPKDADGLFRAMALLVDNDQKRKSFSGKARDFVVGHFDQQYVWNEIKKEYESLLVRFVPGC